jgi:hypothetical protein
VLNGLSEGIDTLLTEKAKSGHVSVKYYNAPTILRHLVESLALSGSPL